MQDGGGMPRLSVLLLASLMLHLATIAAILVVSRRETSEGDLARYMTVEIREQRNAREGPTGRGTPSTAAPTESKQAEEHAEGLESSPPPGQPRPEQMPSQDSALVPPLAPAEEGSAVLTVGAGVGTATGSGPGGGAGFGTGAGTARAGGDTGGSPGGGAASAASGASLQRRAAYLAVGRGLIEAHK